MITCEVCVEGLPGALAAAEGGAHRVELCAGLVEGGTTPSSGTLTLVLERVKVDTVVLVRPRGGDFLYSRDELDTLLMDVATARDGGAYGIATGVLTRDGTVDVAVCDGFAGNLILKSTEGLARMLLTEFKGALGSNLASRAGAALAGPSLKQMLARLDPAAHNGAPLLGLNGVAVKSHGGSGVKGYKRAILEAGREARRQVHLRIERSILEYRLETSQ